MKRIILMGFIIFLLVGCTAEYNLTINNNQISEDFKSLIYISEIPKPNPLYPDVSVDDQLTPFIENDQYPLFDNYDVVYNKNIVEEDEYRLVNYSYTYTPEEFAKSRNLKLCFENVYYEYKDNYVFDLSGNFSCLYTKKLDINVITNNKVISHNADSKNGNKYTWHVNRENVDKVHIKMEIKRNSVTKVITNYLFVVVFGLLILLGIIIILIVSLKRKKTNSI